MKNAMRATRGSLPALTLILLCGLSDHVFGEAWSVEGASFIGADKCKECHEEDTHKFAETKMGRIFLGSPRDELEKLACENCHGPGSAHAKDKKKPGLILSFAKNSKARVGEMNEACLQCHRKGLQTFWEGSTHESHDVACVDCHKVMEKTSSPAQLASVDEKTPFFARRAETETCLQCHEQRQAQMMRSSHMPLREGKMTCVSCHNPHGSLSPAMLIENSVVENCTRCHAEKRGPFLWEHPPVREDCMTCHDAHGSIHANLLKAKQPRLCQQCHIETRHPTQPQAANNTFVFNRSCMNCHPQVHGSNHPSGVRFMR
jgi:DmsE family decaheme c-type cytochrome